MKIKEICDKIIKVKDNSINEQDIYDKIWKLELDLYDNVISQAADCDITRPQRYIFGVDDDKELMLEQEHEDMYIHWVSAWINFTYQDDEGYTNDMVLFNQAKTEYESRHLSEHYPKNRYRFIY